MVDQGHPVYCVFSTVEGVQYCRGFLSNAGDILSTMEDVRYHGGYPVPRGYHDKRGRNLEHREGVHYHGGYMRTVEDILSTVGDAQYHGVTQITKDDIPHRT